MWTIVKFLANLFSIWRIYGSAGVIIIIIIIINLFVCPLPKNRGEKPKIYCWLFVNFQICKTLRHLDAHNSPFQVATIYCYHFVFIFFLFQHVLELQRISLLNKLTNFTVKTIRKNVLTAFRENNLLSTITFPILLLYDTTSQNP